MELAARDWQQFLQQRGNSAAYDADLMEFVRVGDMFQADQKCHERFSQWIAVMLGILIMITCYRNCTMKTLIYALPCCWSKRLVACALLGQPDYRCI